MPTPAVSVLIGAWNNAATLPRAIESILEQTLSDLELIVVDDGSTDETPEVVGRYSDPRLRRLELEHMGISRSREPISKGESLPAASQYAAW